MAYIGEIVMTSSYVILKIEHKLTADVNISTALTHVSYSADVMMLTAVFAKNRTDVILKIEHHIRFRTYVLQVCYHDTAYVSTCVQRV